MKYRSIMPKRGKSVDILVFEHLDPERLTPGGIDTLVQDIAKFSPESTIGIIGITSSRRRELGQLVNVELGGRSVLFLPVAFVDRSDHSSIVPESLRFIFGLLRFSRHVPSGNSLHTHRIETGFVVRLLYRSPVVQFIHNDSEGLLGPDSDSFWRKLPWLYRCLELFVLRFVRRVVLFNQRDSKRIAGIRQDVEVWRTWFDDEVFYPSTEIQDHAVESVSICWVGRIDAQKDPILAIEVARCLSSEHVNFSMQLFGSGAMYSQVTDMIRRLNIGSRVTLCGPRSRVEVAREMRESSVVLMTSHYEGSPIVLAEALGCGTPVVCTSGSDPDDVIRDGLNGFRLETRDPSQIADAILLTPAIDREACVNSVVGRKASSQVRRLLQRSE